MFSIPELFLIAVSHNQTNWKYTGSSFHILVIYAERFFFTLYNSLHLYFQKLQLVDSSRFLGFCLGLTRSLKTVLRLHYLKTYHPMINSWIQTYCMYYWLEINIFISFWRIHILRMGKKMYKTKNDLLIFLLVSLKIAICAMFIAYRFFLFCFLNWYALLVIC